MDLLEVRVNIGICGAEDTVRLLVNGRDLVELIGDFEREFAADLAGSYGLLPAVDVLPPARHFLGEPDPSYASDDGHTMLLGCECGEPGCWPLQARIDATERTVIWREFQQPHRPGWDYARFGPFVFDRVQYDASLAHAAGKLRAPEA